MVVAERIESPSQVDSLVQFEREVTDYLASELADMYIEQGYDQIYHDGHLARTFFLTNYNFLELPQLQKRADRIKGDLGLSWRQKAEDLGPEVGFVFIPRMFKSDHEEGNWTANFNVYPNIRIAYNARKQLDIARGIYDRNYEDDRRWRNLPIGLVNYNLIGEKPSSRPRPTPAVSWGMGIDSRRYVSDEELTESLKTYNKSVYLRKLVNKK